MSRLLSWRRCAVPSCATPVLPLSHRDWLLLPLPPLGRLKYLMACGSAVVMPESPWAEFWWAQGLPACRAHSLQRSST